MPRGKAQKSLDLIDAAYDILAEIQPASVRAVCYRLFVKKLIASMEKPNTNRVSTQLVWARENGEIPWKWIVDDTRAPDVVASWSSPLEVFEAAARQYRRDYWRDQPERIEVWSEKSTVRGTLAPVLDQYAVTVRVMHGYGSATAIKDAADLSVASDKPLTVLYIGDRDPSGMHMSEIDLPDRIDRYGGDLKIVRVAIDDQDTRVESNVPHFMAKDKRNDPRYHWFVENYGHNCWELDALSPAILRNRLEAEIVLRLDREAWSHMQDIEATERESTRKFVAGYAASISGHASK